MCQPSPDSCLVHGRWKKCIASSACGTSVPVSGTHLVFYHWEVAPEAYDQSPHGTAGPSGSPRICHMPM